MPPSALVHAGRLIALTALAASTLAGCDKPQAPVETPPRPIKTYIVTEAAGGTVRRFSGVSRAAETTALSFPTAGTVKTLKVRVGDRVAQGATLAALDPKPFELDVRAATAEVKKAESDLSVKQGELRRNQELFKKGWVSAAALEKYQAAFEAATSTLEYARARLGLAERNLGNTTLRAPYAGTVAAQRVERFQDVQAGQVIVELNSTEGLVVSFSVPETGIDRIRLGQQVSVGFSALGGARLEARVTEIDTAASAGNAYTVEASLSSPPAALRPGMTAEIAITQAAKGPDAGYFVPLSAIAPGDKTHVGAVFKYDAEAGIVRRTPIRARGVRDNLIIVQEGVAPGDVVAAAGVSFLMDGQRVRPLQD